MNYETTSGYDGRKAIFSVELGGIFLNAGTNNRCKGLLITLSEMKNLLSDFINEVFTEFTWDQIRAEPRVVQLSRSSNSSYRCICVKADRNVYTYTHLSLEQIRELFSWVISSLEE